MATREDFNAENYSEAQIERIKLEDAIKVHEEVKVELAVYAQNYGEKRVKPFILVVAQDTTHARDLRALMESDDFFAGAYKGKVTEVHSKQSGTEADANIQKLMTIEDPDEPTEIVVHVNKLKEGWDVTNLYTIVPLRASASEILTEQTIGRGLRLPYGRRTGIAAVDRLTIIAHDRFDEIIRQAKDPDSIIKKKITIGPRGDVSATCAQIMTVPSMISMALTSSKVTIEGPESANIEMAQTTRREIRFVKGVARPIFGSQEERHIAQVTLDVVKLYEGLNSARDLAKPEVQEEIFQHVQARLQPQQTSLAFEKEERGETEKKTKHIVKACTELLVTHIIDIPHIVLIPSQDFTYRLDDFDLENLNSLRFQPVNQEILIRELRTHKSSLLNASKDHYQKEPYLENYIIRGLICLLYTSPSPRD